MTIARWPTTSSRSTCRHYDSFVADRLAPERGRVSQRSLPHHVADHTPSFLLDTVTVRTRWSSHRELVSYCQTGAIASQRLQGRFAVSATVATGGLSPAREHVSHYRQSTVVDRSPVDADETGVENWGTHRGDRRLGSGSTQNRLAIQLYTRV